MQIGNYCEKTTLGTSCAQGEDPKWGELIFFLMRVNFKTIFKEMHGTGQAINTKCIFWNDCKILGILK